MSDDPYQILGVPRGASDEDIRRAYLKLVKELHPEVNPARAAESEASPRNCRRSASRR